ncbi:MAG: hypothetical protein NTZ34_02190 [Chloroflexi bacterium]|nr:hypothetical protein [Chloroflexota bacterium]
MTVARTLLLTDIANYVPMLGADYCSVLAQAAGVCLEDQGHANGVELEVDGAYTDLFAVYWPAIDDKIRRCWTDEQDATENGAYGVAFLLIVALTDYAIIERSYKGPGFDYWLGKLNNGADGLFQDRARLEVSGIRCGDMAAVGRRVSGKLIQVTPSDPSGLPAFIVVVEFSAPRSRVAVK